MRQQAPSAGELASLSWERSIEQATARVSELAGLAPQLVLGLAILVIGLLLARWVGGWRAPYRRLTENAFLQEVLRQSVTLCAFLLAALLALDVMGATSLVAALLGTAGVAGLAIGFAFRDLIENYIAGVLLSVRQPFAPDDLVEVDGHCGTVVRLTVRATILMTPDGNHLRLPNARVFKATILNYTRNPRRRFDFGVGVGVDADLLEAQGLGITVLGDTEGVLEDPPPRALIEELGDSNVLVRFFGWVDQRHHSFLQVKSEAIRRVKTAMEDADIDLPEPIYRLRITEAGVPADASGGSSQRSAAARREDRSRAPSTRVQDDLRSALDEEEQTSAGNLLKDDAALE